MRLRTIAAFVAIAACGGACGSVESAVGALESTLPSDRIDPDAGGARAVEDDSPTYAQIVAKASHNSYQQSETLFDQLLYHRVHGLELDIHNGKMSESVRGDFFVYHEDLPTQDGTSCRLLSDCLRVLGAYHHAFPEHEVVTVFIDRKDDWDAMSAHGPADLDGVIAAALDPSVIFTPKDLLAACPSAKTLREAVGAGAPGSACAWPSLASLRGKFVFGVTGGDACTPSSPLSLYAGTDPSARVAFIAPEISDACTVADHAKIPAAVILNVAASSASNVKDVRAAGLMARVFGVNDATAFGAAANAGANFLATDKINAEYDPWSTTASPTGWPFACSSPAICDAKQTEEGAIVGASVASGDIRGTADSLYFAALKEDAASDATWSSAIATVSSHVEELAEGCLMARATSDADSPYFAVCRPADAHPARAQYRLTKGGDTVVVEGAVPAGQSRESVFFVRYVLVPRRSGVDAKAQASLDGVTWFHVAATTFAAPLPLQGIGVSGHGSVTPVKFLFGGLTRAVSGSDAPVLAGDLARATPIGGATGQVFRGATAR